MSPTAKRWTVYRRGEALGTFTAAEIREQLRKGALSTGDFAAAEGSAVQQELIEIDEIFASSGDRNAPLSESPRKSRWAKRAEELSLQSAPPTRPSPNRLKPGPNQAHRGHRQDRHHRIQRGHHPGSLRTHPTGNPWILAVFATLTAVAAVFVAWLIRRRG